MPILVFVFFREAFDERLGFLAGWMQVVIFYPSFLAGYGVKVGSELAEYLGKQFELPIALAVIVLLVAFHFNVRHALLGFLPILLSWLIVLGAMVLAHVQFNLISIIISTFIFGIGVDYSIFVMNGLTATDQKMLNYHKTAIFFSAVTLIVTVSSMLLAQHPAIKSVGFSTLVGLLSAVILSYVVQPAIYRWISRKKA